MNKFSKRKYEKPDKILFENDHVKVLEVDEWSIVQENDRVVCIPYITEYNQFIIRRESIPTFKFVDGGDFHITSISGQIEEGESAEETLIRELEEEAGIVLRDGFKIDFDKPLFMTKSNTGKIYPCIIPLSEADYHEVSIKTDGSRHEQLSKTIKLDTKYLNNLQPSDLITTYMIDKLKKYLNI